MEIKDRVTADRGEVGHIATDGDMSEEVRVLVDPGTGVGLPFALVRRPGFALPGLALWRPAGLGNTSCDAVWTSSFGSSMAIAPADVIMPLTR